jgi:hypothetical protein
MRSVEFIATRPVFLPTLPFVFVAHLNFQRLLDIIPSRRMHFVAIEIVDRPNVFEECRHALPPQGEPKQIVRFCEVWRGARRCE